MNCVPDVETPLIALCRSLAILFGKTKEDSDKDCLVEDVVVNIAVVVVVGTLLVAAVVLVVELIKRIMTSVVKELLDKLIGGFSKKLGKGWDF